MAEYETIKLELDAPLARIIFNRPKALNAISRQVIADLSGAIDEIEAADDVAVVILSGAGGKAFIAGADIKGMLDMTVLEGKDFSWFGHEVFSRMEALSQPVIAAVDGFALGGGLEVAMCADFIYASEGSRFGQPEVNLGVLPGFGGSQRLPRLVGIAKARELIFTGDMVDAQEALRIGLVAAVYPKEGFLEKVDERARLMASKGRLAIAEAKRVINGGQDMALERANQLENQAFGVLFGTEDRREGMYAFSEKRKAEFKGR